MRPLPGANLFFGELEVTEQVIAYQKRDMTDQHIIDTISLDLPEQTFTTQAFWLAVPQPVLDKAVAALQDVDEQATGGSLHAAEHALIALLPLYAMCDRWDIGGLSTPWHWQTDAASIFVYDAYPGGIGLTKRGFEAFEDLAADARALIAECPCESGCPSCVQSPKCGNLNEPLSKAGAVALLDAIVGRGHERKV
jgi:DEAD/DEAH box helicase domain-containing protein